MSKVLRTQKTTNTEILTVAGTALAQNSVRCGYKINNLGQNTLFVKEGAGASATNFDHILAGGTADDNGTGAVYESPSTKVYTGIITVAGTTPRFNASESTEYDNTNN